MEYNTEEIQRVLDYLTEMHSHNNGFICVEFNENIEFQIRYRDIKFQIPNPPAFVELISNDGVTKNSIPVFYEVGPEIIPLMGDVEKHPPLMQKEVLTGEMGGDQCRNVNSMNYYGTITFYAGYVELETSGRCRIKCGASPALVSNNHVIGRSDAGHKGEVIWTPFRSHTANLECFIPFSCNGDVDVAVARVVDISGISTWTVRTIGLLNDIRRPRIGENIQKHGARTGYKTGLVSGQSNIRVGSHTFRRVFSTTGGFSCKGDSGSAVVASNSDLIGVISWGDDIPCENNPKGYFWTLIKPGSLNDESDYSHVNVVIE